MKLAAMLAVSLLGMFTAHAEAANIGFTELRIANGAERPLVAGVWYPTAAAAESHRSEPIPRPSPRTVASPASACR